MGSLVHFQVPCQPCFRNFSAILAGSGEATFEASCARAEREHWYIPHSSKLSFTAATAPIFFVHGTIIVAPSRRLADDCCGAFFVSPLILALAAHFLYNRLRHPFETSGRQNNDVKYSSSTPYSDGDISLFTAIAKRIGEYRLRLFCNLKERPDRNLVTAPSMRPSRRNLVATWC